MGISSAALCSWLEVSVVLFQVFGVCALCVTRLTPSSRWSEWGRLAFVVALIGLGMSGALCGRHDSEFALFAGGTMTALLIGMTIGNSTTDTSRRVFLPSGAVLRGGE